VTTPLPPEPLRPTLGLAEAARAARVSARTIRRRIDAGQIPNARREPGPQGGWIIPADELLAAGFRLHAPELPPATETMPDPDSPEARAFDADEMTALRIAIARERATCEGLERQLADLRAALDFERTTMRALIAGRDAPEPASPAPQHEVRSAPEPEPPRGLLGSVRRFLGG
jgi:hypothetical protein